MQQNIILSMPDSTPPVILSGPTVSSITDSSAVIAWQTNEKTTGGLKYGLDPSPATTVSETSAATSHSLVLNGLDANATYHVKVFASDAGGNGPVESSIISFTTKQTPDTTAPVIVSGPIVTAIGTTSAVVEWDSNEPSSGHVLYGTTNALGQSANSATLATKHQVTLSGLTPATSYFLQVDAKDGALNGPVSSAIKTFNTLALPDTAPPQILEGPMVVNISDQGATIVWTTDEPATSGVSYNDGTAYGVYNDNALVTEHSVHLDNLSPSTLHNFTVSSKDVLNNGPTLSTASHFTTLATPDTTAPEITEYPVKHVNHQQAIIEWRTGEPASSVIQYGLDPNQLTEVESHPTLTQPHNMTLTGLASGTTYYFRIVSTDAVGNSATSQVWDFTTAPAPNTKAPVITEAPAAAYTGDDTLTVTWETDVPTDTVLEYNAAGEVAKQKSNADSNTKHQVTLKGLTAGTTYNIAVSATAANGKTTLASLTPPPVALAFIGDGGAFVPQLASTTHVEHDSTAPVITEEPTVVGISDSKVTLHWRTDELSDSLIRYGLASNALSLQAGEIQDVAQHTVVLAGLTPNTTYYYRVESIDPSDNGPTQSAIRTFTTSAAADTVPPNFTVTPAVAAVGEDRAVVQWSTNEAATTTLRYGTASGQLDRSVSVAEMSLTHKVTLTNLLPGTKYYFAAEATDNSGNTAESSEGDLTTTGAPLVPGAPAIGTASAGNGEATVTFTGPELNEGGPITSYTVTSNPGGQTASSDASPITVTGLSNGVAYTFTVTASNAVGTGAPSAASNSVTPLAPEPEPQVDDSNASTSTAGQVFVSPPTGVSVTADGTITVSGMSSSQELTMSGSAPSGTLVDIPSGSVSIAMNGSHINVDANTAATRLITGTVTVTGSDDRTHSISTLLVESGSATFLASQAGQVLGGLKTTGGNASIISDSADAKVEVRQIEDHGSASLGVVSGQAIINLPGESQAVQVLGGETVELKTDGSFRSQRLGSASGVGMQAGDPLVPSLPDNITVEPTVPRIDVPVPRLNHQTVGQAMAQLWSDLTGVTVGNATQQSDAGGRVDFVFPGGHASVLPEGTITIDPGREDGSYARSDGRLDVVVNGVVVTVAPAVRDLSAMSEAISQLDQNSTLTVQASGVLLAQVSGMTYAVRPGFTTTGLVSGTPSGFGPLSTDGSLPFVDGDGERQDLHPALADPSGMLTTLAQGNITAEILGTDGGTTRIRSMGREYHVRPGLAVFPATPDIHHGDLWWEDGNGNLNMRYPDGRYQTLSIVESQP